ncbi:copper resistance D family protein [Gemmatimonas sp.]|uniref:copper resistance D family protein n=1 Tax=Gemmatimonas sp. TaxID=1962908 RepID=UPI003983AC7E
MEFAAPLARLLLYVGATLAIGRATQAFFESDVDVLGGRRSVRVALWCGAIALLIAPLLLLRLQQQALELLTAELPGLLRETNWGRGWLQLAIPCALSAILLPLPSTRTTSLLLLMTALGVATAMGGLGHAAADEQWPLASRVFDAMHVAGVGAWIGGLLLMVLASVGRAEPSGSEWRVFSRTATVMAPVVILSGVGSAWRRVGTSGPAEMLATDYGRLLVVKVALALVVLAMGATQRQRLSAGSAPTRRAVVSEVLIAAIVLTVTAWMTGMEPPGS